MFVKSHRGGIVGSHVTRGILHPSRSSWRVDVRVQKGSAGAPPAAFGAPPDASAGNALADSCASSTLDAGGGAPLAAGGVPALPFAHWIGARVPLDRTAGTSN